MSEWPMVKLGNITKEISSRLDDLDLPIYSVTKHDGFVPSAEYFKKQVFSENVKNYKLCRSGDFAYATIHLDEGSIGIAPIDCGISPMYTTFRIESSDAHPEFLLGFLKSYRALAQYRNLGSGSAERRKSINYKNLSKLEIPFPPLGEQKRIAEILDKINSSIESTTNELYILNNLARFSFIKNCGNPNTFSGQIELKKIATIATGNTPPRKEKGYYGNHIEWIKSDNLGGTFPSPASESLSQEGMKKGRIADPGSLLMTCIAGSIKSIGKISIVNRKVAFNQQINSIKPHNSDDLHFLYLLFQIAPELVQRRSTGGLKGIVKKSSLESCKIPWPDKQTRKKMGTFCKEWIDLQTLLYKKLTLLRELQRSLSARAFTGEL